MILEVRNGSFGYAKNVPVLKDICFSLTSGQIVAVLGPNGSGKTTLLRAALGSLKWQNGGSFLDGKSIRSIPTREFFSHVAYVPQARNGSLPFTVLETVLLGRTGQLDVFSAPKKEDVALAEEVLQELGISHLAAKRCSELSGGELQLVLIARALAQKPSLLILDEPESNLDFKNQLIVLDTISKLKEKGIGCLFNTHYPAHALQRADKALLLSPGGSYLFGQTQQIVTEENLRTYFGVEAAIRRLQTDHGEVLDVVPVCVLSENHGI
ncbi:MAG: ABC transporter ATP-binding protein [Clostridia bacterium]|nr:ABC transporter ATP-binding protein [Clostridia bacterium]